MKLKQGVLVIVVAGASLAACSSGNDYSCREAAQAASSGFTRAMENWKWFSATGSEGLLLKDDAKNQYDRAVAIEQGDYAKFRAAWEKCSGEPADPGVIGRTPPPQG